MKARKVWLGIILLCVLGLVAQAEVVVTTEYGLGADTYLTNDSQEGPTTTHGTDIRIRAFRAYTGTRMKIGYIRFDLTGIDGEPNDGVITFDATYLKGGEKSVTVYGLNDGAGDYWPEDTTSYNNAPGFIPNPPTALANYAFAEGALTNLGTLTTPALPDPVTYPVTFSSSTTALSGLTDFIKADRNGLITLIFIGSDNEAEVASKEHPDFAPPRLTLPTCYPVRRASNPIPPVNVKVMVDEYTELSWTNPEPNLPEGQITCDVWFSDTEPNVLLPNWGMTLLEAGVEGNSVAMPTLVPYKTYYWRVDTYDTSREPQFVQGKVWSFNTNNSAPVVNAGPDQYVWLTKTVVDTTSDADTSLRGVDPDGANTYMDVRGGSVDRVGYLRFDLSALSALGPGTLQNVSLTLYKVAGSRNDTITNVAGNTPQNWSEATLTRSGTVIPGQEWNGVVPMTNAITNGWITDLDDNVAGISEVIASDVVTITGSALDAFIQLVNRVHSHSDDFTAP